MATIGYTTQPTGWPGDLPPRDDHARNTWLWTAVLIPEVSAMLTDLGIHIPYLPVDGGDDEHRDTVRRLVTARAAISRADTALLPRHMQVVAAHAIGCAIAAAVQLGWYEDVAGTWRSRLDIEGTINEAQKLTRAVVAYLGIQPEEAGVPDTLTELEM